MSSLFVDLSGIVDPRQSLALNTAPGSAAALQAVLGPADGAGAPTATLCSDPDVDSQLLISVAFQSTVKIHSIVIRADTNPPDNGSGPKRVLVFVDRPHMDFAEAGSTPPVQVLQLTEADLAGRPIPLRFVKFQNVHTLQLFVEANQDEEDVTFVNRIGFLGTSLDGMDMKNFKDQHADHDH